MKKWLKISLIVVGVLVFLGIIGQFLPKKSKSFAQPLDQQSRSAQYWIETEVKSRLKFPKTADFQTTPDANEYEGGGVYDIRSKVTSKNAFGVEIETPFRGKVIYDGIGDPDSSSHWRVLELVLAN